MGHKGERALGIVAFSLLFMLLLWAPPSIIRCFWELGHPRIGVGIAGPAAIGLSLATSAFWNAYLKPTASAWYGLLGVIVVVGGLILIDSLRHALEAFPAKSADEQVMRGALLLWIGVTAFTAKTPWDDLRDKLFAVLRGRLDHLTDPG